MSEVMRGQTGTGEQALPYEQFDFSSIMMKPGRIFEALANVMKEIEPIRKEQQMNAGQVKYNFRGIDDVYNALQPLLAKEGIFIMPYMVSRTQQFMNRAIKVFCRMRYYFYCADGSYVACEVIGEANDTADKGTNKCMSIAHKYALFQIFCIPTADMPDPDASFIENDSRAGSQEAELAKKRQWFMTFLQDTFDGSLKEGMKDVSGFLGRKVLTVSDLNEVEMREYYKAVTADRV